MILRGSGCVCNCIRPSGRQCASGLSLLFWETRCLRSSAAHGWNGSGSLRPVAIFQNWLTTGPGGPRPVDAPAPENDPSGPPSARKFSQIPERSGLPSAVLGAGAARSGVPAGVLGTPAVGYRGHWAQAVLGRTPGIAAATITIANALTKVFIQAPIFAANFLARKGCRGTLISAPLIRLSGS